MLKSFSETLLFMLVVLLLALVAGVFTLAYGWIFTLITPLDLWQTMVLITIASVALFVGFGNIRFTPFGNLLNHLLFGPPIATGIGVLIGWLLTLVTSFDAWQAMLLGVIIVAAITYILLRFIGEFLETVPPELLADDDEDEDMYAVPSMFDDIVWVDKKGRTRRATRKKGKDKKS